MFTTVFGILCSLFATTKLVEEKIDEEVEFISSQFAAINLECVPMDIDGDVEFVSSQFAAINLECVPMDIDGDVEFVSSQFASMKLVEENLEDLECVQMDIDVDYMNQWITVPIDIDEAAPMETEDYMDQCISNECVSMDIDEATPMDMEDWDYVDQYIIECMLLDPDL